MRRSGLLVLVCVWLCATALATTVATPTSSPVAGTYSGSTQITFFDTTLNAKICYTTDGSTPTATTPGTCSHGTTLTQTNTTTSPYYYPSFPLYTGSGTTAVNAIGTLASDTNSALFTGSFVITASGTETLRPSVETQGTGPNCGLSSEGGSALPNFIDYGGESTDSVSTGDYGSGTSVYREDTYSAFPAASGAYSALNLIFYTQCTLDDGGGGTPVCELQYSTNSGSTWTTVYNVTGSRGLTRDTIALSAGQNLSQVQVRWCYDGDTDNETYDYYHTFYGYDIRTVGTLSSPTVATPAFSVGTGTYAVTQSVTITDSTGGSTICYTTDGSTPTATTPGTCSHGTTYSTPVAITATGTVLQAIGTESGYLNSAIQSATYTLTVSPAPTFSPVAGTYSGTQNVTISDSDTGTISIYYNTTGSPTCSSTLYTTPVVVSSSETLYALACETNFNPSTVASAGYTINATVANPTFSPGAGTYTGTQSVTISTITSGATVCYTTNGATPTDNGAGTCTGSTLTYSTPVAVAASETLKAIGTKSGDTDSGVASAAYVIASGMQPHVSVMM